jgi:Tol biopolymer transport system component
VFVDQAGSTDLARAPEGERWGRITVLDLATGRRTVIGRGTTPAWSPDGKRVAFVRYSFMSYDNGRSLDPYRSALFTVASDGSDLRQVYSGSYGLPGSEWMVLYGPTWSPDSRTLAAYGAATSDGENALVLLTDASNSAVRTLLRDVPSSGSEVAWSPDGSKLAFTANGTYPTEFIETVDVVTEATKRVTRSHLGSFAEYFGPRWSPEGRQIAFERCPLRGDYRCELYTVALANGRTRRITPMGDPAWNPLDWG